jgi:hypothetical protein
MLDESCAICRILQAAVGQKLTTGIRLLRVADQVRCHCPGTRHRALYAHPHTPPGCAGYALRAALAPTTEKEPRCP